MRDALLLLSLVTTSTHALLQPVKRRPPIAAARAVDSATPRPLKSSDKMVKPIVDEDSFLAAMAQSAGDRVVAIKFYASWCRACKSIAPRFERLARDYDGEAAFFEIEFASNKDLCRRLEIKKLPCVQFFRGSDGCIDTVMCGPSKFPEVKVALEKHIHHDVPYEYTDVSSHYDD
mmetsp:Transcript_1046/g.3113  ORF Transcript_1046/g.3113 Transcript_1046/m.3113 type:complete len:175 (+) Transcript_1046:144-668(+)